MAKPEIPQVGQVVRHHFLWAEEQEAGRSEGAKARPCIIIAIEPRPNAELRVTLLPITSQPPRSDATTIAIPAVLATRFGLDPARPAWVVIDHANVFTWPGFDLVPSRYGGFIHGAVTSGFFQQIASAVLAVHSRGKLRIADRNDL